MLYLLYQNIAFLTLSQSDQISLSTLTVNGQFLQFCNKDIYPYICKSCRLMGQTGSGLWSSFLVRTGIIPQFVCLKTAPRPPQQQQPRSHSMTTYMMFTGLCLACFLLLTLSYIASTLPFCMSPYQDGLDQTAVVKCDKHVL